MRTSVTLQSNLYKHTQKVVPIYSGNTFPKREYVFCIHQRNGHRVYKTGRKSDDLTANDWEIVRNPTIQEREVNNE